VDKGACCRGKEEGEQNAEGAAPILEQLRQMAEDLVRVRAAAEEALAEVAQDLLGEGGERVAAVAVAAVGVELVESGALGDEAVGDGGEAGLEERG